jgi:hypothetical protein
MFKYIIDMASDWFDPNKLFNTLYKDTGNGLVMKSSINPLQVKITNNRFIGLEPSLVNGGPGVILYMGNENIYTEITMENFLGLKFIVNKFDPVMYSATMMNYIHPEGYGYNMTSFGKESEYDNNTYSGNATISKNKSFLDDVIKLRKKSNKLI